VENTNTNQHMTDSQSIFDRSSTISKSSVLQKILVARSSPQQLQQSQINQCQKELFNLLGKDNSESEIPLIKDSDCLPILVALYKPAFDGHITPDETDELVLHLGVIGFNISLMWLKKHLITFAMLNKAKKKTSVTS
jgi:hypothetical protein